MRHRKLPRPCAVLRAQRFQLAALTAAASSIGVEGFTPHGLRHTAASLAIAAGADVKVIQKMLGHKSAAMTLDRYGHLFPDRLDTVADALEAARTASLAKRTAADLLRFPAGTGDRSNIEPIASA